MKFYKKEIHKPTHLRDVLINHKQLEEDDIEVEQLLFRQCLLHKKNPQFFFGTLWDAFGMPQFYIQ